MTDFRSAGAAVIGTGFIGTIHLEALRRLGVNICGVLGSSAERTRDRANDLGVTQAYPSLDALLTDDSVTVVHVTSPNVLHHAQVKQILAAGRHVICEKPLAMTSVESAEMVTLARASGKITAVCYNTRFYPLNQHAMAMVAAGKLGDIRLISGHYHQDWLSFDTDWNWRLDADEGGLLRSVGDIGTHWVDLTSFIAGEHVSAVFAELATFIPERQKPVGRVETFSKGGQTTEARRIATDDAAMILLRYPSGARGVLSTSQISHGRKNALSWEITGSAASAAWHSETPDHLWIGHRNKANQVLQRDPSLMNAVGTETSALPGGHVEGFADTFVALFRQVYQDIAAGQRRATSSYASFEDAHREMVFCDAVLVSSREGRWVDLAEIGNDQNGC